VFFSFFNWLVFLPFFLTPPTKSVNPFPNRRISEIRAPTVHGQLFTRRRSSGLLFTRRRVGPPPAVFLPPFLLRSGRPGVGDPALLSPCFCSVDRLAVCCFFWSVSCCLLGLLLLSLPCCNSCGFLLLLLPLLLPLCTPSGLVWLLSRFGCCFLVFWLFFWNLFPCGVEGYDGRQ
jgi:hypothetical protein